MDQIKFNLSKAFNTDLIILKLTNVGKRFNREWIFRNFNYQFSSNNSYAITGSNGSGKSTLLQIIAGSLTYNEGNIQSINQDNDNTEQLYKYVSIAAPYIELVEELTANEFLMFHAKFKNLILPNDEILKIVGLEKAANKQVRYYSSGMKQRLKMAQAFFSNTPILLLDEPTTNLDEDGISLYHHLINNYTKNKLLIISSNDKQEYNFCQQIIEISQYK